MYVTRQMMMCRCKVAVHDIDERTRLDDFQSRAPPHQQLYKGVSSPMLFPSSVNIPHLPIYSANDTMTRPTKRPRCSSSPSEPSERQNQRVSSLSPLSSPDSDGEDYLVRLCRSIRSGLSNGGPSRTKATRPAPAVKSEPSRPTELPIE